MDEQNQQPQNSPTEPSQSPPPVQPQPNQPPKKPGGYGKRPLWQWVVLYLVVGAVVYFVVYLLFFNGSDSSGIY